MSLVFPQMEPLAVVVARSPVVVLAEVLRTSNGKEFIHVRVERSFRGGLPVAAELEIHPAGYAQGCQVAESMANGGLSVSYALPLMEGKAPAIRPKKSYVFLLLAGLERIHEMSAMQSWRAASEAEAIEALCGTVDLGNQPGIP
jgi:hypothetical protein